MAGHVFISYSHGEDSGYAETLAATLTKAGVPVWFDKEIVTGDRWALVIRDQIDNCAAFVVVMTPAAEASDWVAREINRADAKAKPIFPLLLRGQVFFRLSNIQFEDVIGGRPPRPAFVARLRELTKAAEKPAVVSELPPARPARRRLNRPVLAGLVVALLIASVVWVAEYSGRAGVYLSPASTRSGPDLVAQLVGTGSFGYVAIAFSPDGGMLALTDEETANLYDVSTGRQVGGALVGHGGGTNGGRIYDVAFSPNGRLLATASDDGTARLWDTASHAPAGDPIPAGIEPGVHPPITHAVEGVAFSPDSTKLATVGLGEAAIWDVASHEQIARWDNGVQWDVAFSPDGTLVATVGGAGTWSIWSIGEGRRLGQGAAAANGANVFAVAFFPDGKILATGAQDGSLRLWSVTTYERIATLSGDGSGDGIEEEITGLAVSRDGSLIATAGSQGIRLRRVQDGSQVGSPLTVNAGRQVAFGPDSNRLASTTSEAKAVVWDITRLR